MTQIAEIELMGCEAEELKTIGLSSNLKPIVPNSSEDSFSFAPNPLGEERKITLQLPNSFTNIQIIVAIYSMEGKLVYYTEFGNKTGKSIHELQLDRSLPTGIYFMFVKNTNNHIISKKIILK